MFGPSPSGQSRACSVHHQYSSSVSPSQAKTGNSGRGDRRGGVVLGGEDVAARPAHLGAERDQGLDQDRGLHRHVEGAGDPGALQRLLRAVLLAGLHQARHLDLGQGDLLAPEVGEADVGDLVVLSCRRRGHLVDFS
jgi:hypothetical protein